MNEKTELNWSTSFDAGFWRACYFGHDNTAETRFISVNISNFVSTVDVVSAWKTRSPLRNATAASESLRSYRLSFSNI
jgi:hypothetical protein